MAFHQMLSQLSYLEKNLTIWTDIQQKKIEFKLVYISKSS